MTKQPQHYTVGVLAVNDHLSDVGVEETVIIVGYLKERIYDMIGTSSNGMKISEKQGNNWALKNAVLAKH